MNKRKEIKVSKKISDLTFIEKIIFYIRRYIIKRIIDSKKNMIKNDYIQKSKYEKNVINICRSAIKNPNSKIRIQPDTGVRLIHIPDKDIYIIVSDDNVDIINHTYHYPNPICRKTYSIIRNIFDGHAKVEINEWIAVIHSNITVSLETINDKIRN